MTPVRSPRSFVVHVSHDLRRTLCGKRMKAWLVEPEQSVTCLACHIASTTN